MGGGRRVSAHWLAITQPHRKNLLFLEHADNNKCIGERIGLHDTSPSGSEARMQMTQSDGLTKLPKLTVKTGCY